MKRAAQVERFAGAELLLETLLGVVPEGSSGLQKFLPGRRERHFATSPVAADSQAHESPGEERPNVVPDGGAIEHEDGGELVEWKRSQVSELGEDGILRCAKFQWGKRAII